MHIFEAVKANQSLRLRTLIQNGADPNARDETGETPLTWAANLGHTTVVKDLLAAGADVETRGNRFHAPPLILAARSGARGIVALLAVHADLDAQDAAGTTALMRAVERPEDLVKPQPRIAAIVRTLLDQDADPNVRDNAGNTAVMWAVRWGNPEAIRLLAGAGADLQARNLDGETAPDLADSKGYTEIVKLFRDLEIKR
ncbi:MAG TPA: ankyrin repeat domain-containing protein [Anaerolineales bacterium]|nr:ankyrin repeat domain-containing protein [Anaerolineales bacterium]